MLIGAIRVTFWGALAMALTAAVGRLFGVGQGDVGTHANLEIRWSQVRVPNGEARRRGRRRDQDGHDGQDKQTQNGGRGRGMPRLPSMERIRAVSSPQTKAPAPNRS